MTRYATTTRALGGERDPQPIRVLLHAINGGLGHLSRLIAVALELRSRAEVPVLLLFLSEADTQLLDAYGLSYLPIRHRDQAIRQGWPYNVPSLHEMLVAGVNATVRTWKPDLVIHDTHIWEPMVRAAAGVNAKQVGIIRATPNFEDFLRSSAQTLKHMDLVLLPHEPESVGVGDAIPPGPRVNFVGEIVRRAPIARGLVLGAPNGPRILVVSGGGGLASTSEFFADVSAVLGGLPIPRLEVTFVLGPRFAGEVAFAGCGVVRILPFVEDMQALAAQHDIIVCQGGYNTLGELGKAGHRIVCVPQPMAWDDQLARAEALRSKDDVFRIACSTDEIRRSLIDLLSHLSVPLATLSNLGSSGAGRAADCILQTLGVELGPS